MPHNDSTATATDATPSVGDPVRTEHRELVVLHDGLLHIVKAAQLCRQSLSLYEIASPYSTDEDLRTVAFHSACDQLLAFARLDRDDEKLEVLQEIRREAIERAAKRLVGTFSWPIPRTSRVMRVGGYLLVRLLDMRAQGADIPELCSQPFGKLAGLVVNVIERSVRVLADPPPEPPNS